MKLNSNNYFKIKQQMLEIIELEIDSGKFQKKDLVEFLGMTNSGFNAMFKNDSMKFKTALKILEFLDKSPRTVNYNDLSSFQNAGNNSMLVSEPTAAYGEDVSISKQKESYELTSLQSENKMLKQQIEHLNSTLELKNDLIKRLDDQIISYRNKD